MDCLTDTNATPERDAFADAEPYTNQHEYIDCDLKLDPVVDSDGESHIHGHAHSDSGPYFDLVSD